MALVDRVRDPLDRRSVIVKRTVGGALFLEKFGDRIIAKGRTLG
jgi:DNA-binding MarR family transcriptional regulator